MISHRNTIDIFLRTLAITLRAGSAGVVDDSAVVLASLVLKIADLDTKISAVAYRAAHALTERSQSLLKSGALFRVHDNVTAAALFCGFFVDSRVALTINHDSIFSGTPPLALSATSAAGRQLSFDVVSTHADLDFTVLRLASGCDASSSYFSLHGFSELLPGLVIAVATMGIGAHAAVSSGAGGVASGAGAGGGAPAYAVHRASIVSFDDAHIRYDGAETWAGDSGGALLFEEGCIVGMHLKVVDAKPSFAADGDLPSAKVSAGGKWRARGPADAGVDGLERIDKSSVASSSHGKICVALRLTHPAVLEAVERACGGGSGGGGGAGGGAL